VLYEKNGVITEERFKRMTLIQWIFHYLEIMKNKREDNKNSFDMLEDVLKSNLRTISGDLELLGVVMNAERGIQMIDIKQKVKDKSEREANNIKNGENNTPLATEDEELMKFFNAQPETREAAKSQLDVGKFFLPTVDIKKKMTLGFGNNSDEKDAE